jgi:hypothetical protein
VALSELFGKEVIVEWAFSDPHKTYWFTIHASGILGIATNYLGAMVSWCLGLWSPAVKNQCLCTLGSKEWPNNMSSGLLSLGMWACSVAHGYWHFGGTCCVFFQVRCGCTSTRYLCTTLQCRILNDSNPDTDVRNSSQFVFHWIRNGACLVQSNVGKKFRVCLMCHV